MEIKMMINFLNREAEDYLDNPEIIAMYDSIIGMLKLKERRKKYRDIIEKINTMLDMREGLDLENHIMESADKKIKIYNPELNIIRIDIKE